MLCAGILGEYSVYFYFVVSFSAVKVCRIFPNAIMHSFKWNQVLRADLYYIITKIRR